MTEKEVGNLAPGPQGVMEGHRSQRKKEVGGGGCSRNTQAEDALCSTQSPTRHGSCSAVLVERVADGQM